MFTLVLILHLLGAAIWTGGHLVLSIVMVPSAFKQGSVAELVRFESRYERIGIPALLLQVLSGIWLADVYVPGVLSAFSFTDRVHTVIAVKLILLIVTVLTGAHARLRLVPGLSIERLPWLAVHVFLVTIMAVVLLVLGVLVHH